MSEQQMQIVCPDCGTAFSLEQKAYAAILEQVRNQAFHDEVARRFEEQVSIEKRKVVLAQKEQYAKDYERHAAQVRILSEDLSAARHEAELLKVQEAMHIQEAVQKQKDLDAEERRSILSELEYYKDMKTRMSTKMVGESLEQHCLNQFNQIRMAAFPHAYFEKDNDARTGSKGDFIFREEQDGVEILSIMFEMKNEMDTTATKHRNEDFIKELDKDRREKGCEYAVLVSLLESDSELYNQGIVDVSYRYGKMYVVRPQCFIPIITILRGAAMKAMDAKRELSRMRERNLDVVRFTENLCTFKDYVSKNYDLASRHFEGAIAGIDKTIAQLEKVKKELTASERNLRLLNDKTEGLTISELTKDAPEARNAFVAAGISV